MKHRILRINILLFVTLFGLMAEFRGHNTVLFFRGRPGGPFLKSCSMKFQIFSTKAQLLPDAQCVTTDGVDQNRYYVPGINRNGFTKPPSLPEVMTSSVGILPIPAMSL